jgi:branched-chain amino acid transport system ATP-binding protein
VSGPAALEVSGVSVRFGGVRALTGVSLRVPAAGLVGLLGPNGAGKTTLFGVISGLVRPQEGRVEVAGRDVTRCSPARRCRAGLARTFQRLELFEHLTVRDHLVLAWRMRHGRVRLLADLAGLGTRRSARERDTVDDLLALFDLGPVADQLATHLPLGLGRVVEVARAVATDPVVLLADEPFSGLSVEETRRLAGVFRRLRDERGVAACVVEHDVETVLGLADRVTVLDFGEVIAEGTPAEIRADATVQAAYLGVAT